MAAANIPNFLSLAQAHPPLFSAFHHWPDRPLLLCLSRMRHVGPWEKEKKKTGEMAIKSLGCKKSTRARWEEIYDTALFFVCVYLNSFYDCLLMICNAKSWQIMLILLICDFGRWSFDWIRWIRRFFPPLFMVFHRQKTKCEITNSAIVNQ